MKRTPLPRSARLSRKGRIKRKGRKASEANRIYGPVARRRWVKSLPCVYCVAISPVFALVQGQSHNAHVETGGTGRKADYDRIVPLCYSHHRRYDQHMKPFDTSEARELVKSWAPAIEAAWQAKLANPEHVGTVLTRVLADL